MKKFALALLMVICATGASAGVIHDIQIGGLYTPGDIVTATGVVAAVAYDGVWIAEAPYGIGNGIFVYLGSGHTFVLGEVLEVTADYKEYYDLSELGADGYDDDPATDTVTVMGTDVVPAPLYVTAADIMADPEPYEGNVVFLTDGFQVTELLSYGEWNATALGSGAVIGYDDVMFDETVLVLGSCYDNSVGPWHYSFGAYKQLPLEDGLTVGDCAVSSESTSFGTLKALYR